MSIIKKSILSIFLCVTILCLPLPSQHVFALSTDSFAFIILSQYKAVVDIGDELCLIALPSNGKVVSWKSSDSRVASVNTYGIVTAKKSGSALITAKVKNAEASCYVTVNKTKVILSASTLSMERGETKRLSATTSNNATLTWKSSKKSIATIDDYGIITAIKPGSTVITATANDSSVTCNLTVRQPKVTLDKSSIKLYRGQTVKLSATVSSNIIPTWKTNKKSVALIDENGYITAIKNGTAIITATVDGISKTCQIIVQKPDITLNTYEIQLKKGDKTSVTAIVSSRNEPIWSTSNTNVVNINSKGEITALKKGTAYIYAAEDGTKVKCTVKVTE
jgi:uncharacterized protein YjdB